MSTRARGVTRAQHNTALCASRQRAVRLRRALSLCCLCVTWRRRTSSSPWLLPGPSGSARSARGVSGDTRSTSPCFWEVSSA